MHDVVVYSSKDCHLCEIVKNTLMQVQRESDFQWREVDIDADPELQRKFTDEVPVGMIDRKLRLRSVVPQRGLRLLYCDHVEQDGERLFRLAVMPMRLPPESFQADGWAR